MAGGSLVSFNGGDVNVGEVDEGSHARTLAGGVSTCKSCDTAPLISPYRGEINEGSYAREFGGWWGE